MAGIHYTGSKKPPGKLHHVVSMKVESAEVRALVPRVRRDVEALVKKWQPIVKKTRMKAEVRMKMRAKKK